MEKSVSGDSTIQWFHRLICFKLRCRSFAYRIETENVDDAKVLDAKEDQTLGKLTAIIPVALPGPNLPFAGNCTSILIKTENNINVREWTLLIVNIRVIRSLTGIY